ncbi:MAG: hypothetical protein JXB49_01860 [Bacteroidales bacterium]|nr:hypothetical protein [Bacteroidales bacterium]
MLNKKFVLAATAVLTMVMLLSSCEEEENNNHKPKYEPYGPSIVITDHGIHSDQTLNAGSEFKVVWVANKGDNDLALFTITRDGIILSGYPKTDIPTELYYDSTILSTPLSPGVFLYEVEITDKIGLRDSVSFYIYIQENQ